LQRDAQSLDSVFRELTRGDEKMDRGRDWADEADDDESDSDKESN
jgi:hypothetical protein